MRRYETIFIASPTLTDEQSDELVKQFEGIIAEQGGELLKTDKWGRKKLAYEIQKFSEGYYTLFEMNAGPDLIAELERRFRNHAAGFDQALQVQPVVPAEVEGAIFAGNAGAVQLVFKIIQF